MKLEDIAKLCESATPGKDCGRCGALLREVAEAARDSPHEEWCESTYKPPNRCNCWRSAISDKLLVLDNTTNGG